MLLLLSHAVAAVPPPAALHNATPSSLNRASTSIEWIKIIAAGFSGGLSVKILDIAYQETRRYFDNRHSSSSFIDQHLDPLLKAADELVGKLLSLGKEDFKTFSDVDSDSPYFHPDFASASFLFAMFWAQIEILRQQALYVSISSEERGRQLQKFLNCLESRKVRLIDRISQRAVGETLLAKSGLSTIPYIEFAETVLDSDYDGLPDTPYWLDPLETVLRKAHHTSARQQLLKYGVIVHAMIDTLDPDHSVTRNRPSIPNKLSIRTWRDLNYRVFRTYLEFVKNKEKYIGPPKNRSGR